MVHQHAPFAKREGARASEAMRAGDARGGADGSPPNRQENTEAKRHVPFANRRGRESAAGYCVRAAVYRLMFNNPVVGP